jgi:hypothetical protein
MVWTKQLYKWWAKPLASFMLRMVVMLCPVNSYELITDRTYRPELGELERFEASRSIREWHPEAMQR